MYLIPAEWGAGRRARRPELGEETNGKKGVWNLAQAFGEGKRACAHKNAASGAGFGIIPPTQIRSVM